MCNEELLSWNFVTSNGISPAFCKKCLSFYMYLTCGIKLKQISNEISVHNQFYCVWHSIQITDFAFYRVVNCHKMWNKFWIGLKFVTSFQGFCLSHTHVKKIRKNTILIVRLRVTAYRRTVYSLGGKDKLIVYGCRVYLPASGSFNWFLVNILLIPDVNNGQKINFVI